jgi:hypothetical protein
MLDLKHLIGEVAAKNGIRLEPDDPAFALVTLNQLVLEETANGLYERISSSLAKFADSLGKAESRAGKVLADEVRCAALEWRKSLNEDLAGVNARAADIVAGLDHMRTESVCSRRAAWAMIAGALLLLSGVAIGVVAAEYIK